MGTGFLPLWREPWVKGALYGGYLGSSSHVPGGRGVYLSLSAHLIGVGPILVLGTVTGVAEGLAAAFLLTHIRLLSRVRPKVRLQVFEA